MTIELQQPGGELRRQFARGTHSPGPVRWLSLRVLPHYFRDALERLFGEDRKPPPDRPPDLVASISKVLGGEEDGAQTTLAECLKEELWIDFVADTGDDATLTERIGGLLVADYVLPAEAGAPAKLPRGQILLIGGDFAYPTATQKLIETRLLAPLRKAFKAVEDGRRRVLLGVPGNHDWVDHLRGFRQIVCRENPEAPTLPGYERVQSSSYFALPIAPALDLLAVDRRFGTVDRQQRTYFEDWMRGRQRHKRWVVVSDPEYPFGDVPVGQRRHTLEALRLLTPNGPNLVTAGDNHHYRRESHWNDLHITAGGGGASLHPMPVLGRSPRGGREWPSRKQSLNLLWRAPWNLLMGRAGLLLHALLLGFYALPRDGQTAFSLVTFVALAIVGGVIQHTVVLVLAAMCAGGFWLLPLGAEYIAAPIATDWAREALVAATTVVVGCLLFGYYLVLLTVLGLQRTLAYACLTHPGFRHFLRFRVDKSGSQVDGYCIGLVDPANYDDQPVLVDRFSWRA